MLNNWEILSNIDLRRSVRFGQAFLKPFDRIRSIKLEGVQTHTRKDWTTLKKIVFCVTNLFKKIGDFS